MANKMGFWVDLDGIQFDEGSNLLTLQGMPIGKYNHPVFGEIDLSPERIRRFADNVNNRVRGTDLDIDYDHKEYGGKAAGWIQSAEDRGQDGLWLNIELTPPAAQAIKNKEYRYFSPEFIDEWEHPKTGQKFQDVLFGGALTNRPFLKDIAPINMSEVISHAGSLSETNGGSMNPTQRAKYIAKFKLADDASDEDIYAAIDTQLDAEPEEPEEDGDEDEGADAVPASIAASEALKKLAEENPGIQVLLGELERQNTIIMSQQKALDEQKIATTLSEISDIAKSKGFAIPPATLSEIEKTLTKVPVRFHEAIVKPFKDLVASNVIDLSERRTRQNGGEKPLSEGSGEASEFQTKVKELQEKNPGLSVRDAMLRVSAEHPELAEDYRRDVRALGE